MNSSIFSPRPSQKDILSYRRGRMGISAVPGSGKTWTLSQLAAEIIISDGLDDNQEILIVTLTNSAVDNFKSRIDATLQSRGSPSLISRYRVCTLHSLAYDLVREHPNLVGIDNDFQILDENGTTDIIHQIATHWLRNNEQILRTYFTEEQSNKNPTQIDSKQHITLLEDIAKSYIRTAKDFCLSPEALNNRMQNISFSFPLAHLGNEIYRDYQRILMDRGFVDYDDLIYLALEVIKQDPAYLTRLQYRWKYILEDEAQDSSRLQEKILRTLVGTYGNWVRVGDPNQAIYETFTTANPKYLKLFLSEPEVRAQELPESGRSTETIIHLANRLISWTVNEHPNTTVRDALTEPFIRQAPPNDPQPNPEDRPSEVYIYITKLQPDEEVKLITKSITKWLPNHTDETVAILAPNNHHAFKFVEELKRQNIEVIDGLLRSSNSTRIIAEILGIVIDYLINPQQSEKLVNAYKILRYGTNGGTDKKTHIISTAVMLGKCTQPEAYLFPNIEHDWLENTSLEKTNPVTYADIVEFRDIIRYWQGLVFLPVDQIILALSQELFTEPMDLATAHHLAVSMRRIYDMNPDWQILNIKHELINIAENKRKFTGYSQDDIGFNPDFYKGKVVVATMHKSKGMEWDRVYLTSVNNYDFPSNQPEDIFQSEKWFIRNNLNLPAEAIAQLKASLSKDEYEAWYQEGIATQEARLDYVRERLRLLYVGITRAKKELVITWNSGKKGNATPSIALKVLNTALPI
ncbi:MAG: ATP-dependent helicase [Chloroflexota bacterium]